MSPRCVWLDLLLAGSEEQPRWPKQTGAAGVKGLVRTKAFYTLLSLRPACPFILTGGDSWEQSEGLPCPQKHSGRAATGETAAQQARGPSARQSQGSRSSAGSASDDEPVTERAFSPQSRLHRWHARPSKPPDGAFTASSSGSALRNTAQCLRPALTVGSTAVLPAGTGGISSLTPTHLRRGGTGAPTVCSYTLKPLYLEYRQGSAVE